MSFLQIRIVHSVRGGIAPIRQVLLFAKSILVCGYADRLLDSQRHFDDGGGLDHATIRGLIFEHLLLAFVGLHVWTINEVAQNM